MATHVWAAEAFEIEFSRNAETTVSAVVGAWTHPVWRWSAALAAVVAFGLAVPGCAVRHGAPEVVDRTSGVGVVDAASPPPIPVVQAPLTSAGSALPLDGHRVERGDTLYGIAWRYGLDYREIARLNNIEAPYRIFVGQQLVLMAPANPGTAMAAGAPVPLPAEPLSRGFEYVPETDSGQPVWQPAPQGAGVATTPYHTDGTPLPDGSSANTGQAPGTATAQQVSPPPFGAPGSANASASATNSALPGAPVAIDPVSAGQRRTEPPPAVDTAPAAASTSLPSAVAPAEAPAVAAPAAATPSPAGLPEPAAVPEPAATPTVTPTVTPEPATQPVVRAERPASGVGTWRWPAKGTVQKAFGNGNKGIDFKLEPAQPVLAAGGGEVVYAGNGLGGFRHLVIVKHDQRFLSAYSLNRPISVQEGERLASGGIIAGADPGSAAGTLRFEIRRDGQPVDPASIIGR